MHKFILIAVMMFTYGCGDDQPASPTCPPPPKDDDDDIHVVGDSLVVLPGGPEFEKAIIENEIKRIKERKECK